VSLGTIALGERLQIWQTLNMQPPSAYTWAQEHKVLACFSAFFLGNSVEGGLVQTGAFEVELNGMPVWSKLKSGRIPQGDELFDIINNQMSLSKNQFTPPKGVNQFEMPPQQEHQEEEQNQQEAPAKETPTTTTASDEGTNDFGDFDNDEDYKEEL